MIILASSSPRRAQLLTQIGVDFRVQPADIDESVRPDESAHDYVTRLSQEKAGKVLKQLSGNEPGQWVLGCDTTVVSCDGQLLGKPADEAEAKAMLRSLSDTCHQVISGVALMSHEHKYTVSVATDVTLCALSDEMIHAYIKTGEPFGKSGAYAIQGKAAVFVESVTGSFSNVVGLPLKQTADLLAKAGVNVWQT